MNLPIYLETERMSLRELRLSDEDLILELDSDPEVMRYLTDGEASTREHVRGALMRTQDLYQKHGGRFGFWGAIEKETGNFMGWFHFRPSKKDPDNVKRIELGYRLKKAYWGKGFATEGSRALVLKGFTDLGVDEIFATTMAKNLASQKVMEKVGLSFSKNYVEDLFPGSDQSAVEYLLSKAQWEALHRGSCLCGAVRFEVKGDLPPPSACHCIQCRKHSGHFEASTDVLRSALTIYGPERIAWYHTENVRRGFCSTCGSSLFWDPAEKDWTAIAMGAFDTPTHTKLKMHIYAANKGDYYDIADSLPQNAQ